MGIAETRYSGDNLKITSNDTTITKLLVYATEIMFYACKEAIK